MTSTLPDGVLDAVASQLAPHLRHTAWPTPGAMATTLERTTVNTPALELIDDRLTWLTAGPDRKLIISMAPQEGKSRRVARDFPVWALAENPNRRIVLASHDASLARRNGRAIRDMIARHGGTLGIWIRGDLSGQSEWELSGHAGGVYAVGIGGSLTGRPADILVIDDPIKSTEQANSEAYRQRAWDWWTDVAAARLSPGAPVVLILTRWHEDDLAGRLLASEDGPSWEVLNIPAQAEHDPATGEVDVLGRTPGEFMVSARGRTQVQWEMRKRIAGARTWASQYQGHPNPPGGSVFQREWFQFYDVAPWIVRSDGSRVVTGFDEVMMSWDMTFKDTAGTDMVVGQVWGRRGADAYLLDQVRDRMDFVRTLREFVQLAAKWPQATLKLVEDKANGPAVIAMLSRRVPGIVPEEPQGSKVARASAVSPLVEGGNVLLPDPSLAPWVGDYVEEMVSFPNGVNDDQVDASSQALNRVILQPLLAGAELAQPEEYDMVEARGYWRSPV